MKQQRVIIIIVVLVLTYILMNRNNVTSLFYFANPKPTKKPSTSSSDSKKSSSSSSSPNFKKRDSPVFYAKSYREVGKALETLVKHNVDQNYINKTVSELNKTVKNGSDFFKAVNKNPVFKALVKVGYIDSPANQYLKTNAKDWKEQTGQNYITSRTTPRLTMKDSQYPNGEVLNIKPVNELNPQMWPSASYKPDLVVTSIDN